MNFVLDILNIRGGDLKNTTLQNQTISHRIIDHVDWSLPSNLTRTNGSTIKVEKFIKKQKSGIFILKFLDPEGRGYPQSNRIMSKVCYI